MRYFGFGGSSSGGSDVIVTSELGQSTTEAASQKLLTDTVGDINIILNNINGGT